MSAPRRAVGLALLVVVAAPPGGWWGSDKLKHFLMSALVHSSAFSIARATGAQRSGAQAAGVASALTIGVWKELRDRRLGRPFSIGDLVWDGAGVASSAAFLNRSR